MIKLKTAVLGMLMLSLGIQAPVFSAEKKLDESAKVSLAGFVKLLGKDYEPSIADYQQYFGYSDIEELQFQWAQCQAKKQTPYLRNKDCYQGILKTWYKKETSPSAYLAWLRKLLPINPIAKLLKVKPAKLNNGYKGNTVTVDMQGVRLIFWQPDVEFQAASGEFSLVSIKGVPLAHYRKTLDNVSVLMAMGLTELIRPLTKVEVVSRKATWDKKCASDPVCAKEKAADTANKELEERSLAVRKTAGKAFETWCSQNATKCQEQRTTIAEMDKQIYQYQNTCGDDYSGCISRLLKLEKQKIAAKQAFCSNHKAECDQVAEIRRTRQARDAAWCKADSERCQKMNSPFDNALVEVYGMLYNQKKRGS